MLNETYKSNLGINLLLLSAVCLILATTTAPCDTADDFFNKIQAEKLLERGRLELKQSDLDNAIVDYSQAIKLKPDYAEAYRARGEVYFMLAVINKAKDRFYDYSKGSEMAIENFTEAINLKPDDPEAYVMRGAVEELKGDIDRAKADRDKAAELNPTYANVNDTAGAAKEMRWWNLDHLWIEIREMTIGHLIGTWCVLLVLLFLCLRLSAPGVLFTIVCAFVFVPLIVYAMFLHSIVLGLLFGALTLGGYIALARLAG